VGVAAIVLVWIPLLLGADHFCSYAGQVMLAVLTWALLLGLLRRQDAGTRAQVAIVVVFASMIEWGFSAGLHVYSYRLHEHEFWLRVPPFVPPGHGLVYLAALCVGRSPWVRAHARALVRTVVVTGGLYAGWSLLLSGRDDVLGVLWYGCLLLFLRRGRQPLVYVGAFVVVTWLELWGTGLGTWAWAHHSPTGLIPMGNPPADAAGGYGFFDAAALWLGPSLASVFTRRRVSTAEQPLPARA
jgi:hypothetical protein